MTAATQGRNTNRRDAQRVGHLINPGTQIWAGTMIALLTTNGNAVPAGTAGSGDAVGVAQSDGLGDGTVQADAWRGHAFHFANSAAADQVTRADIGASAFVVDDQTVAKTDNSAARKVAGKIIDVDAAGVWVLVG